MASVHSSRSDHRRLAGLLARAGSLVVDLSRSPITAAIAVSLAFTVYVTWPQALYPYASVTAHPDTFFSMWRLSWLAHALQTDAHHLFDGNIYYPEPRTLAYSDATLLQGALGAPLLWMGAPPTLVYNLLFMVGIAASGVAMFALARHLVGNTRAALVAAAAFTVAPYRALHYMHLELQWTMWIPLALLALHRTFEERTWRLAALTGVCLWLQILSCVYYGIFLSVTLAFVSIVLLASDVRRAPRFIPYLAVAVIVAAVLTIPYAMPYLANAKALGERPLDEVNSFSAVPISYLTWPAFNRWFGWTATRFQGEELRLAPGIIATLLAVAGVFAARKRKAGWMYLALCALMVELSLGMNGFLYPILRTYAAPFRNLRAPARFSVVAVCALALLSAYGVDWLERRLKARPLSWVAAAILGLMAIEAAPRPLPLYPVRLTQPPLDRYIASSGPSVIAEFPMPSPVDIPRYDPYYEFYSRYHWRPLVNGYSGYYSQAHMKLVKVMTTFPDDASMAALGALNVRFIVVHEHLYPPREFANVMVRIATRQDLISHGRFQDGWGGVAELFEVTRR